MKKLVFFYFISLAFISNGCHYTDTTKEFKVFFREFPTNPISSGFINIEINNNEIFVNNSKFITGNNKLKHRDLNNEEKTKLDDILKTINIDSISNQYVSNEYDAMYYYDFYISIENKEKDFKIFQDELPSYLKEMIVYIEQLSKHGEFQNIEAPINEIEDINIKTYINSKNDTLLLSSKDAYYLWKELMYNDYKIKPVELNNLLSFNYKLPVIYFLNYKGQKIKTIYISKGEIYYEFENNKVYLLDEKIKLPGVLSDR